MHGLDMPAGSTVRLLASARSEVARHVWEVRVHAAGGGAPAARLAHGSRIGDGDHQQRIDPDAGYGLRSIRRTVAYAYRLRREAPRRLAAG
jgi:hypothetical protein